MGKKRKKLTEGIKLREKSKNLLSTIFRFSKGKGRGSEKEK